MCKISGRWELSGFPSFHLPESILKNKKKTLHLIFFCSFGQKCIFLGFPRQVVCAASMANSSVSEIKLSPEVTVLESVHQKCYFCVQRLLCLVCLSHKRFRKKQKICMRIRAKLLNSRANDFVMTDIYRGNHPHLQKADQGRRACNMRLFLQTEETSIQSPPEDSTHFI